MLKFYSNDFFAIVDSLRLGFCENLFLLIFLIDIHGYISLPRYSTIRNCYSLTGLFYIATDKWDKECITRENSHANFFWEIMLI